MTSTPMLQLALDMLDLATALTVARQTQEQVDVIEAGTLLCLSEGMAAVRELRRGFPDHLLLADVRIVRAGGKIAKMAFEAGADRVTVVAEAPYETMRAAAEAARHSSGEVQVELAEEIDLDEAKRWRDLGIRQTVCHNGSEVGLLGDAWSRKSLETIGDLAGLGFAVTVTGGIKLETIPQFAGLPVSTYVAGRTIWSTGDPEAAAKAFRTAIRGEA